LSKIFVYQAKGDKIIFLIPENIFIFALGFCGTKDKNRKLNT